MDWVSLSGGYPEFSHLLNLFVPDPKPKWPPKKNFLGCETHYNLILIKSPKENEKKLEGGSNFLDEKNTIN